MNIRRRKQRSVPGLNMASMPDLIFTVLFFFMIVTHMRTENVKVKYEVPAGTEVTKGAKKYANINIYIGKDDKGVDHIQLNNDIITVEDVMPLAKAFKDNLPEDDAESATATLRADRSVPMSIVNDVKMELRKAGITTIRYSASELKE